MRSAARSRPASRQVWAAVGEPAPHVLDPAGVEVHRPPGAVPDRGDRPGHDVAGGQLGPGVELRHEPPAVGVDQNRALAAESLGEQPGRPPRDVQAGGVELDELDVAHRGAGVPGQGDAVARGPVGAGSPAIDPRRPARGQHHPIRLDLERARGPHPDHPVSVGQEALGALGDRGHARGEPHRSEQGLEHAPAGGVAARVQDAARAVPALKRGGAAGVEDHPSGSELGDRPGRLRGQDPDRFGVAQAGPRLDGVAGVGRRVVAFGHRGRDPALGPRRGASCLGIGGDDGDLAPLGGVEGAPQAGRPGPDDDRPHGSVRAFRRPRRPPPSGRRARARSCVAPRDGPGPGCPRGP